MKTIATFNGPLAHLKDLIFENLPEKDAQAWPGRFLSAIEPSMDLWPVWYRWISGTLREDLLTLPAVKVNPQVVSSIQRVMGLYDCAANGTQIKDIDWETAHDEACAAWRTTKEERASTAAWSAAWLVTARKATVEVRMAVSAVLYAVRGEESLAEAGESAWTADKHRLYRRLGDRLIGLMQPTKDE